MPKWVKVEEKLPGSCSKEEICNPYYTVKLEDYQSVQAMFLDGEWYTSYISKIIVPVLMWLDESEDIQQNK